MSVLRLWPFVCVDLLLLLFVCFQGVLFSYNHWSCLIYRLRKERPESLTPNAERHLCNPVMSWGKTLDSFQLQGCCRQIARREKSIKNPVLRFKRFCHDRISVSVVNRQRLIGTSFTEDFQTCGTTYCDFGLSKVYLRSCKYKKQNYCMSIKQAKLIVTSIKTNTASYSLLYSQF